MPEEFKPKTPATINNPIHYDDETTHSPHSILPPLTIILSIALLITSYFTFKYFKLTQQTSQASKVTSYEECTLFPGSFIQESYPAVCLLPTGEHFIQNISSPIPSPTPSPSLTPPSSPIPSPTPSPSPSPTPSYNFSCPDEKYIDCMPGPQPMDYRCNQDYLNWASNNCPGFMGAAY